MATVKPRLGADGKTKTYEVRWKDPQGKDRTKSFKKSKAATDFAAQVETAKIDGTYVDPRTPPPAPPPPPTIHTIGSLAQTVLASKLDPNTLAWYGYMLQHVNRRWEHVEIGDVIFLDVQAWVHDMVRAKVGPPTIRGAFIVFHEIVKVGLNAQLIGRDPCLNVKKPSLETPEMLFLTEHQVDLLSQAMEEAWPAFGWGTLVQFTVYSGCRAGEVGGLLVKNLNLLHERAFIEKARKGYGRDGQTKTKIGRWVSLPSDLCEELAEWVKDKGPEDRVWTGDRGGPLDHHWFYERRFKPVVRALTAAGHLPMHESGDDEGDDRTLRFHDLRHTCVALLIAEGADMYDVMDVLGHRSIKTTIDTYAHRFPHALDRIRDRQNAIWKRAKAKAAEPQQRPIQLPRQADG